MPASETLHRFFVEAAARWPDNTAVVTATIQVQSVSQLARLMGRIETLKDVISVQRDLG